RPCGRGEFIHPGSFEEVGSCPRWWELRVVQQSRSAVRDRHVTLHRLRSPARENSQLQHAAAASGTSAWQVGEYLPLEATADRYRAQVAPLRAMRIDQVVGPA